VPVQRNPSALDPVLQSTARIVGAAFGQQLIEPVAGRIKRHLDLQGLNFIAEAVVRYTAYPLKAVSVILSLHITSQVSMIHS
jgi:hypothetical protein